MTYYFISGNVPSLKNSKQIVRVGNMPRLIPSKRHSQYAKETKKQWIDLSRQFCNESFDYEKPLTVGFYFIRDSKRKFDYENAISTCQDLMVEHGWLIDDNMTEIIPIPIGFEVNKEKSGVYITILKPLNIEKPRL